MEIWFWRKIDKMPIGESAYISSVLKFLKKPIQDGVDFHKKNHMKFIMRNMIEKWIDYYSMFGETIPITSDYFYITGSRKKRRAWIIMRLYISFSKSIGSLSVIWIQRKERYER